MNEISLKPVSVEDADFVTGVKTNRDIWYYEPENDIPTDYIKVREAVIARIGSDEYMDFVILDSNGERVGECHLH
jgi:hypothetical protein